MQESIVILVRVQCRRKESSRSLSHLLMSFLLYEGYGWPRYHQHGVETLPKISIAWVGCTNVTDDRQTDGGRHIANVLISETRSSATAKSTARPSCLMGVLYDIYRRQTTDQQLINHLYETGHETYRIPRHNAK